MSVALTLVTLELGLRFALDAWPFPSEPVLPDVLELGPGEAALRWRFSAGESRNRLGLRNREIAPKPPGTTRILFLGDSLIWSGETSSRALYTEVIETRLNARRPYRIEVVNAGVPGYTTFQELEFLRIHGLGMEPDAVLLGFVFNDLYYPYLHRPQADQALDGEPDARRQRFDRGTVAGRIFGRSYMAHETAAAAGVLWRWLRGRPTFPFDQRADFYLAWKDYGWVNARRLIGEMKAMLAERGVPLYIAVFPVVDQVDPRYRQLDIDYVLSPQRRIRRISDELAIPLVDLTEPLRAHGGTRLFSDYVHLKGEGNDVVADQLEAFLVERGH